ncbi:MAG: ketoacyl-ACP synthase III [Pseudomonadales bacterium]
MEQLAVSKIAGVGHYFPDEVVSSDDLMEEFNSESRFGLPARYLSKLAGIEQRRWSPAGTRPSSLAIKACEQAIENAGIQPSDIDCVIYCGIERDWQEPATAHAVQHAIGASQASCFDLSNACHGFMNGISVADAFIATGSARICLLCTGEIGSHASRSILRQLKEPRCGKEEMKFLLGGLTVGDAGGAMILKHSQDLAGFRSFKFQSAGAFTDLCFYSRAANDDIYGEMHMEEIVKETLDRHADSIEETYQSLNWTPTDVDTLFSHQVGARVHKDVCRITGIEREKAPTIVDRYGNIMSATIPALFSLYPPQKGDKVLIISSGSGLTIGQSAMLA